ncbi:MAG: pseudouridine synthase [Terriglobales bacterium]
MPSPPHKQARRNKPEMTLDRVLSRMGVASRSDAVEMIRAGRVTVDGRVVTDPLYWIETARQTVRLDGARVKAQRRVYYALHKPRGVITSHGDPQGRKTVYDLLGSTVASSPAPAQQARARLPKKPRSKSSHVLSTPPSPSTSVPDSRWLFPVGRLDQDTSGLLLLTNDSIFAERITNPATKVDKTYLVKVNALATEADLERLRNGLDIGRGEQSGPATITYLRDNGHFCWLEIVISEGKNRQVRRMIEALGYQVLKLVRTRIGKLELGDIPSGTVRAIQPSDVL